MKQETKTLIMENIIALTGIALLSGFMWIALQVVDHYLQAHQ